MKQRLAELEANVAGAAEVGTLMLQVHALCFLLTMGSPLRAIAVCRVRSLCAPCEQSCWP